MAQSFSFSLPLLPQRLLVAATGGILAALIALSAQPAAAQPPATLGCNTDYTNLVAAVTGSSGNGGLPNRLMVVDAASGQTTVLNTTTVVPNHLAYDWAKQLMYYVDHSGQALYAYGLNSGVTTLVHSDLRAIPGNGDMPSGFTGHDAGTFWNNRFYLIPHNGTTGQTGDDLHWIQFDATGLTIVTSGLLQMSLPAGYSHMGDFGDIVIDSDGILFGSSSSNAGNQLEGLFRADMNLAVPAVTVLNPAYTGAQLALSGNGELYGNDWQTGVINRLSKVNGSILSTATLDFGGDFFDMAPISPVLCDRGDLPEPPYATMRASNGPAHKTSVAPNVRLGSAVDAESDGLQSLDASGDGADDDGVLFLSPLRPGGVTDIRVTASGAGVLNAWIDFNSDGDFNDAGEQIATNRALVAGANTLDNVPVPANASGVTASRFRLTRATGQGGSSPVGSANNGEVEDYRLACIAGTVWNDLDGDGIQDGGSEVGVQGVNVNLLSPVSPFAPMVDGNGALVTTTTDANGNYQFCGLPTVGNSGLPNPGSYRVLFDRPAAFSDFSPPNQGGNDALDSDADQDPFGVGLEGLAPLDSLPPISLVANQFDDGIDAGLRAVTAALITSAGATNDGGTVIFEFSTGYEALTGGFEIFRYDHELGDYVAISDGQVPALLGAPQGGVYRVRDETAPFAAELTYVIVEHQTDGRSQAYGPYAVKIGRRAARGGLASPFAARAHRSQRLTERVAAAVRSATLAPAKASRRAAGSNLGQNRGYAALQLEVSQSGLHWVSAGEIAQALELDEGKVRWLLNAGQIALENRGLTVAWLPSDSAGSGLYFYGQAIDSLYTRSNVYRLHLERKGQRMPQAKDAGFGALGTGNGTFTAVESYEEDLMPAINSTLETEVDHWYWTGINAASADTVRTFEVAVPDAVGSSATLRVRFAGASNGGAARDHHAIVRVNGVEIATAAWGGMERHEATMAFDGGLLTPATTIEVEGTLEDGAIESIFFIDGFELEYERSLKAVDDRLHIHGGADSAITVRGFTSADVMVFELADRAMPRALASPRVRLGNDGYEVSFRPAGADTPYLVTTAAAALRATGLRHARLATDLKAAHHRYDHLVIAPEAWQAEAQLLADHRSRGGLRSLAVSLEEVYDTFSHGVVTPWAVRDFLSYAHAKWSQGPDYVVLAGRGTLDPRNLLGGGDNHLPVVLVGTPYGLIPSDNVLADLSGDDSVPEVAIGRLPIVSGAELASYIAKLEAYEGSDGAWRHRALLLADNRDAAGDFPTQSDHVGAVLGSYQQQSIHLSQMPPAAARAALLAAWNQGSQLINYVGHGGVTQAAAEGLLRTSDMPALTNLDRLPIVSALTCVLGRSDIPNLESLAEALVTDSDGGAIAVWAPSGVSLSGAAHELNLLYAAALESAPPATPLGSIVMQVLRAFGAGGGLTEMLDTYGVVGDPAVQLP